MSFQGSKSVLIRDLSGNVMSCASGSISLIPSTTVTISVSGNVINVSGNPVKISGETVISKISGETVTISGQTVVSENTGNTVRIHNSGYIAVTDVSGGAALGSGTTLHGVRIRNLTSGQGNAISGVVWVGGSGVGIAPYSGYGYLLAQGEILDINVRNFNQVRLCAQVSGCFISVMGTDFV